MMRFNGTFLRVRRIKAFIASLGRQRATKRGQAVEKTHSSVASRHQQWMFGLIVEAERPSVVICMASVGRTAAVA